LNIKSFSKHFQGLKNGNFIESLKTPNGLEFHKTTAEGKDFLKKLNEVLQIAEGMGKEKSPTNNLMHVDK